MNIDHLRHALKTKGFVDSTGELSRNSIRYLDSEVRAGQLTKTQIISVKAGVLGYKYNVIPRNIPDHTRDPQP